MVDGGPTHRAISPTQAAGSLPMNTVGGTGPTSSPPTWGTAGGVTIGQMCISVIRAAGILPMNTVGQPGPVIIPPWAVMSRSLAAGLPTGPPLEVIPKSECRNPKPMRGIRGSRKCGSDVRRLQRLLAARAPLA